MEYVPSLGLVWKVNRKGKTTPGTLVGGRTPRSHIRLNGVRVLVHHIVWFLHKGYWPSSRNEWIDHRDGNELNRTIDNLRSSTPSQNNANRSSSNNLGKGVNLDPNNSYRAHIQFKGTRYYLGTYETVQEAAAAYKGASIILHGEYSVFRRSEKEHP